MLRMRSLVALVLALSLLSLTACSRRATAPPPAEAAAPEPAPVADPVTVRLLYWPQDEGQLNALVDAFYQHNAQIRIEKVLVDLKAKPEERSAQVKAKADAGEIDLVPTFGLFDQLPTLAVPLDDQVRTAGLDLKPYGALLDELRIGGTLYQLPYAITPVVILYNPELFAREGVPWPAAGWTWDKFRSAAAKLTSGPESAKTWGIATPTDALLVLATSQFRSPVDPEQAQQQLQYWEALLQQDKSVTQIREDSFDFFSAGRAGMHVVPLPLSQYQVFIRNMLFTPGIAPLPTWPNQSPGLYILRQSSFAITAGSKHRDAAWQVLQFMAGPEGAQVLARSGVVPAYRSEAAKYAWFEQSPTPSRSSEFLFSLPYMDFGPANNPAEQQVQSALYAALTQVIQGKATADAAYQQFLEARAKIK